MERRRLEDSPHDDATRSRRGSISVLLSASLAAFFLFISFTIAAGDILQKRQQLQDLVDASALAGAAALRDGANEDQAAINASLLVGQPEGSPFPGMSAPPGSIEVGRYDFAEKMFISPPFGGEGIPAVRVSLPLSVGLVAGSLGRSSFLFPDFLSEGLGLTELSFHAEAIAVVKPRDIVIVQDITGSFQNEFEFARQADLALVDIIADSFGGLGDQIGVVTFGREAQTEFPLTPVAEGVEDLKFFLSSTMEVCTSSSRRHRFEDRDAHRRFDPRNPGDRVGRRLRRINCAGTGTASAINHATLMLRSAVARGADPVIVLVTDGVPCHLFSGRRAEQWVARGKAEAVVAASAARESGVRIFVVDLSVPPFGSHPCSANGSGFNIELASHGFGTTTDDPDELEQKLLEVANKLTLRLVE